MSGQLVAGDFVRVARMADQLEISHTPVREALSALRAEGVLELEPNRGFRVAPLQPAVDVRDMFMVQAFVGGELAARAAANLTDADLEKLSAICDEFELSVGESPDELETINRAFHDTINDCAGSPGLARFYTSTVPIARHFYRLVPGWTQLSVHDHRAILAVLEMRDSELARERVKGHIEGISRLVVATLGDAPAPEA
jgi:DNA-binding GntR family transcriptional regulator